MDTGLRLVLQLVVVRVADDVMTPRVLSSPQQRMERNTTSMQKRPNLMPLLQPLEGARAAAAAAAAPRSARTQPFAQRSLVRGLFSLLRQFIQQAVAAGLLPWKQAGRPGHLQE